MPLYEFKCMSCSHIFEELCAMGATGEGLACPACGTGGVRKQMSTFSGRTSSGDGSYQRVGGGCSCGGDCGSCGGSCGCHH